MAKQQWYKDKVFYQIWPRSFKDGNGDGMEVDGEATSVLRPYETRLYLYNK